MLARTPKTHIYICGLQASMEEGVEKGPHHQYRRDPSASPGAALRDVMRDEGRYHVETY